MIDDGQLLRAYVEAGSASAFGELVARYASLVYGCGLRQLGDAHAAEDVSQAVFMVLARKAGTIRAETPLAGWLFNVARYTASNYRRIEARRIRREMEAAAMKPIMSAATSPQSEVSMMLDEAIASLSRKERDVVVLRFYQDKALKEVGVELGITEDAAAQRISRALRHLHEWMSRRGVAVAESALATTVPIELSRAAPAALAQNVAKTALQSAAIPTIAAQLSHKALRRLAWHKLRLMLAVIGTGTAMCAAAAIVAYHVMPRVEHTAPAATLGPVQAKVLRTIAHPGSAVMAAAIAPDGMRALTGGGTNLLPAIRTELRLWDLQTGEELQSMHGHSGRVVGVAFAANQRAVSAALDGTARVWDLQNGNELHRLDVHVPIMSIAVSPDGKLAAIGARRFAGKPFSDMIDPNAPTLRLWDLQTGEDLHRFDDFKQGIDKVAFAPDGQHIALAMAPRHAEIVDLAHARSMPLSIDCEQIAALTFSPDGTRVLAAGSDGQLHTWDAATGAAMGLRRLEDANVMALAISPDGKRLISAGGTPHVISPGNTEWSDCLLYAWDMETGKSRGQFKNHATGVYSLSFSADGHRLLSAGGQKICLWDIGD